MAINAAIKESLVREYDICSKAIDFYEVQIKGFEKKHRMSTRKFLKLFGDGEIGDEQDFFDWYSFHKLASDWTRTKNALHSFAR
jgi:hypothetical protein